MFKSILIPTDGSALARKGAKTGIALAKSVGAKVVAYHSVEPIERIYYLQGVGVREADVDGLRVQLQKLGERYLAEIARAAAAQGVECETLMTDTAQPHAGIIDAARKRHCDLICMASHGRGEIASALLGNVAQKVLTHSKVPVLVCR
jgi:nucleotide-binding universal stress UspA family protein